MCNSSYASIGSLNHSYYTSHLLESVNCIIFHTPFFPPLKAFKFLVKLFINQIIGNSVTNIFLLCYHAKEVLNNKSKFTLLSCNVMKKMDQIHCLLSTFISYGWYESLS